MTSADIHALTGAYALDAVSGTERSDFERHLAECESCAQEVLELRDTAARLALAATATPPPGLRDRVLEQVRTVRQVPPDTTVVPLRRRSVAQRLTTVAAAVFFLATAALGVVVVRQGGQLDDANARAAQIEQILTAEDGQLVTLDGSGGDVGTMKVAVSRELDRGLFLSDDLANAPAGKTYQLWAIADNTPRSLGVVEPVNGTVVYEVSGLDDAQVVAITIEEDGGVEQPTTDDPPMLAELPA